VSHFISNHKVLTKYPEEGFYNIDTSKISDYVKKINNEIESNPGFLFTFFGDNNTLKGEYGFFVFFIAEKLWNKGIYIRTCHNDISTYCIGRIEKKADSKFIEYAKHTGISY
jgi:hypothetical protein